MIDNLSNSFCLFEEKKNCNIFLGKKIQASKQNGRT
jgi:hypothetical protein